MVRVPRIENVVERFFTAPHGAAGCPGQVPVHEILG
jgi:hypothetical protein